MGEILQLIRSFQLPCRCGYQHDNLLFLIIDATPEFLPSCFNIVQDGMHLYLHQSFSHVTVPLPFIIPNYSGHEDIVGATSSRITATQPSGPPSAKRALHLSIPHYRSAINPIILPTIQSFPDDQLLRLRSLPSPLASHTDPSLIAHSLATFYQRHTGGNTLVR